MDENTCIRYLMKEMDPSEEVVFENEMLEDENLLIEVESLRSVKRRLNDLPLLTPPEAVTDKILDDVTLLVRERKNRRQMKYTIMSAAATIVMVLSAGTWLVMNENQEADSSQQQAGAGISAGVLLPDMSYNTATRNVSGTRVSPWVDKNDVLHFEQQAVNGNTASLDSLFNSSFQKLERVTQPDAVLNSDRFLHVTGSPR